MAAVKCQFCGAEGGYPPFTCATCGHVTKDCPCCKGTGAVDGGKKRGGDTRSS
jgi:hypothetical protein